MKTSWKSFRKCVINFKENNLRQKFQDHRAFNLLMFELSSQCLAHLQEDDKPQPDSKIMSEREIGALQYLSGHVVHKIYLKLRKSQHWREEAFQNMISLLRSLKIEPTDKHKYIKVRDRGGLWYICDEMVEIFQCVESIFRDATQGHIFKIDYPLLIQKCMTNYLVKINFQIILKRVECTLEKDISKDLLEKLIGLFLRIRAHSYAKDVKEKHKLLAKTAKKRSLRKELKKNTDDK